MNYANENDIFLCLISDGTATSSNGSTTSTSTEKEKEDDVYANISIDKAQQYSIILAEINRKFMTVKQPQNIGVLFFVIQVLSGC